VQLHEQYRPGTWTEVVGQDKALRKLDALRRRGLAGRVVWLFTTTVDGQESLFDEQIDAHPLLSRRQEIPLARRDLAKAFAERAKSIAQTEGLDGKPIDAYVKVVQKYRNNLRAVLQEVEAGAMME